MGEDGKTTYGEPDTIINGVEDYGYTGVTATHHSALEHLQVAVRFVAPLPPMLFPRCMSFDTGVILQVR